MKPAFSPTPEQFAIVEAARTTSDNLCLTAYAGAAKTSTLVLIAEALSGTPILSLAFNKKIAEEMSTRLPGHCRAATLNSIGHRAWSDGIGRRVSLDFGKNHTIWKSLADGLSKSDQKFFWETFSLANNIMALAKTAGYIPPAVNHGNRLIDRNSFINLCVDDEDLSPDEKDFFFGTDFFDRALTAHIKKSFDGSIDFADQIYMPTLFGGRFPSFPLVLVDEAQDLSLINHVMLSKLVVRRVIAVGDPNQAIYGWRGALSDSMSVLMQKFSMRNLTLSVSFRCPKKIVEAVSDFVPLMRASDRTIEGSIITHSRDDICMNRHNWLRANLERENTAVICRSNAPLFSLAFMLLRESISFECPGMEIGMRLARIMKKFGPETMTTKQVFEKIEEWRTTQINEKKRKASSLDDQVECMKIFAAEASTLGACLDHIKAFFAQKGIVKLLSGHKSKGLEFDYVYHLDPWRIPSRHAETDEELRQEQNLSYVITTRTKRELHYFNLADLKGESK